jgi:hypothetical protein
MAHFAHQHKQFPDWIGEVHRRSELPEQCDGLHPEFSEYGGCRLTVISIYQYYVPMKGSFTAIGGINYVKMLDSSFNPILQFNRLYFYLLASL